MRLTYVGMESADLCSDRVALRVGKGGHSVPAADIRRRYRRSMAHLRQAISFADQAMIYDNSTERGHRLVLALERGVMVIREPDLPHWVMRTLGALLA